MRTVWFCLIALTVQLWFTNTSAAFYPYGPQNKDNALAKQDDAFTSITINFDFPFFGKTFSVIHISTNGIIYFGQGSTSFTPVPFPINGTLSVAAYWVDSDPREGGDIFYREEFDPVTLGKITSYVRSKFVQFNSFTSTWALIVTFSNVSRYSCRGSSVYPCRNVVNHQTILTSNGIHSFVIFLYDRLEYANAQIGFNAGDKKRFFLVPYSNTENITRYALENSNVGSPGEWLFSISEEISSACDVKGLLEIYPKKVLYFGQQDLFISGPCIKNNISEIEVQIGNSIKTCSIVEGYKIFCLTPYFDYLARIPINFTFDGVLYKSFLIPYGIEDPLIKNSTFVAVYDSNQVLELNWNQSAINSNETSLKGVRQDIWYDSNGNIVNYTNVQININIKNSGVYPFTISKLLTANSASIFFMNIGNKVFEVFQSKSGNQLTKRQVEKSLCDSWYDNEPSNAEIKKITEEESKRNPCQPRIADNFPDFLPGGFKADTSCNPWNPLMCFIFHEKAKGCYRSTNNPNGRAVQCCYDENNLLLFGPPGGGTLDMVDSDQSKLDHFWKDVRPYFYCCIFSNECNKYYDKRPSVDSRHYIPPRPVRANGDPHFVTMDGTSYEFNPVGEFIYLKTPNTIVQTRIQQFIDNNNVPKLASYFSAFVIKIFNNVTIQIELSSTKNLLLKCDNEIMNNNLLYLNPASVEVVDSKHYNVETGTGLSLHFSSVNGMLHVITSLQPYLKGQVQGLIGNWDDNPSNDFMLPNGTWIPSTSSPQDIHYKFGMSWSTTNRTTIFTYPERLEWKDFQNPNFVPFFGQPPMDPRCGNNSECAFDVFVTGDINVGLSNLIIQNETKRLIAQNDLMNQTCPSHLSVENANVTILKNKVENSVKVTYTLNCDKLFQVSGNSSVSCVDGTFSGNLGTCSSVLSFAGSVVSPIHGLIVLLLTSIAFISVA